ncbi:MAG: hypothetical protein LCI00_05685 [Chloroflexi bacterium]|nr:hypothetical protein [Chloroflexota bacterium]
MDDYESDGLSLSSRAQNIEVAANRSSERKAEQITGLLRQVPSVLQAISDLKRISGATHYRLVVTSDELRKQIASAKSYFVPRTDGGLTTNIMTYGEQGIKGQARLVELPPDFTQALLPSMHQMALQSALTEITNQLKTIEKGVQRVLQGQRDDRAGLLDSGINLYLFAVSSEYPENRQLFLKDAIAQLSEARARLILSIRTEINTAVLPDKPKLLTSVMSELKGTTLKDVEVVVHNLELLLRDILLATQCLAIACCEMGEPNLVAQCWKPIHQLLPFINKARLKLLTLLPTDAKALPDGFSTAVSIAEYAIERTLRLESGEISEISIELPAQMLLDNRK